MLKSVMSLFLIFSLTIFLVSCACPNNQAPAPVSEPKVQPKCQDCCYSLVDVTHQATPNAILGQVFETNSTIRAKCNLAYLIAISYLPTGATFVKSEPAAEVDGRKLTWRFDCLEQGQTVNIKTWYKAENQQDLLTCAAIVQALPGACAPTRVGKPLLEIVKRGPASAQVGDDVPYEIIVSNKGNATVEGLVVTDIVPEGMAYNTQEKTLSFNVGRLEPQQSKTIPLTLKAVKRGKWCNVAEANSSNAGKVSSQACTEVKVKQIDLVLNCIGEEFVGKRVVHQAIITNGGDAPVTNVAVNINAPAGLKIVSGEPAPTRTTDSQAIWNIPSINPGEKVTLNLTTAATSEGRYCVEAMVNTAERLSKTASCCTVWKGVPKLEIVKNGPKTAMPNEEVVYTIIVKNIGTGTANDVVVTDRIPEGLQHSSGQRTLSFRLNSLAPNATSQPIEVRLKVVGKGQFCNVATAKASNTEETTGQACTEVRSQMMKMNIVCPKDGLLKKPNVNKIAVSNPGDIPLTRVEVRVRSTSPNMIIIGGDCSPQVSGDKSQATWMIPTIQPGETKECNIRTVTPAKEGSFCLEVETVCAEGLRETAKCCSNWYGLGGVLIEVIDSVDPLVASQNEQTLFTVKITNQGSADIKNVNVTCEMDPDGELKVITAGPNAKIQGDSIAFATIPILLPGTVVTFTITAQAIKEGDHILTTKLNYSLREVTGEQVEKEVSETESTHVY